MKRTRRFALAAADLAETVTGGTRWVVDAGPHAEGWLQLVFHALAGTDLLLRGDDRVHWVGGPEGWHSLSGSGRVLVRTGTTRRYVGVRVDPLDSTGTGVAAGGELLVSP